MVRSIGGEGPSKRFYESCGSTRSETTVGTIRSVRLPCASMARRVVDPRLVGLLQVAPHTIGFLARTWVRSLADAGLPTPAMLASLTPALRLPAAMDHVLPPCPRGPRP